MADSDVVSPGYLSRDATITEANPKLRTLTVQLLRWDQPRVVADPGYGRYTETWARGSLVPLDRLIVLDRHGGELIGRMDPPTDGGARPGGQGAHRSHPSR